MSAFHSVGLAVPYSVATSTEARQVRAPLCIQYDRMTSSFQIITKYPSSKHQTPNTPRRQNLTRASLLHIVAPCAASARTAPGRKKHGRTYPRLPVAIPRCEHLPRWAQVDRHHCPCASASPRTCAAAHLNSCALAACAALDPCAGSRTPHIGPSIPTRPAGCRTTPPSIALRPARAISCR